MSEDCYKYGGENKASDEILAKAASLYGGALINIEKENEDFNKLLTSQVTVFRYLFYSKNSLIFL